MLVGLSENLFVDTKKGVVDVADSMGYTFVTNIVVRIEILIPLLAIVAVQEMQTYGASALGAFEHLGTINLSCLLCGRLLDQSHGCFVIHSSD